MAAGLVSARRGFDAHVESALPIAPDAAGGALEPRPMLAVRDRDGISGGVLIGRRVLGFGEQRNGKGR